MTRPILLLALLAPALLAEEGPSPLPEALRPGAAADFDQAPLGDSLGGTLRYRVEPGDSESRVLLTVEFATKPLAPPLTFHDRLRAVLDIGARRFVSFTYEGAGGSLDGPLKLLARMSPDPDLPGRYLHERFRYAAKGEPKVTRTRPKLEGLWVPDRLEPFAVALLDLTEGAAGMTLVDVAKGRPSRSVPEYTLLGEGNMTLGDEEIPCRILRRSRGERGATVYYRAEDMMPLRHDPSGVGLRPRRTEDSKEPR